MMMRIMALVLMLGGLAAQPAFAADVSDDDEPMRFVFAGGVALSKTDWRRDAGAQTSLELGITATSWLSFHFLGRLGYGLIDDRILTYVSAGAKFGFDLTDGVWTYARVSLSHQHEEPSFVVEADPLGAVLGVADGIRHRGGGEVGVGVTFDVAKLDDLIVFVAVEGGAVLFPDSGGPHVYAALSTALGVSYAL